MLANVSCAPATVDVPAGWAGTEVLLPTYAGAPGEVGVLWPWEAVVHRRTA